ncbi:hypothetical protein [Geovibrio ferrireducens]|uniref:hypothetical protein n=1 Tax=Geovibrio ferrireducens TaxID=46201 RepID=UPI0022454882|nr:hypothetical protein [Geovibrio ferrireducens]
MVSNKWLVVGMLLFASACGCGEKDFNAVRCENMPDLFRVIFPEDYPLGLGESETDPAVSGRYFKEVVYTKCL